MVQCSCKLQLQCDEPPTVLFVSPAISKAAAIVELAETISLVATSMDEAQAEPRPQDLRLDQAVFGAAPVDMDGVHAACLVALGPVLDSLQRLSATQGLLTAMHHTMGKACSSFEQTRELAGVLASAASVQQVDQLKSFLHSKVQLVEDAEEC